MAMNLTIQAKTVAVDSNGVRSYTFDPDELKDVLQRSKSDVDVDVLDGNGARIRTLLGSYRSDKE